MLVWSFPWKEQHGAEVFEIAAPGSRAVAFAPGFEPEANDLIVIKDRYSAFQGTSLDRFIVEYDITISLQLPCARHDSFSLLMAQQIKTDMGQRLQALQSRVSGVESIQREHAEEVARLRNDLAGVRQELASVREENVRQANQLNSQIHQVEQAHESTRNDLSSLDKRLTSNQTALAYQVDRKRVDFELQNGRTQQVVDGIYVTVKKTDVEHQKVDGWVQIASDGRFVWLRGEGAQNPIGFSSRGDARIYQMVFTQVGREKAAGYILVPITSTTSSASN